MAEGAAEERRLVVVMFTDMVDYAARAQEDEALALQVLEEHNRLLRSVFALHGGQEIRASASKKKEERGSAAGVWWGQQ